MTHNSVSESPDVDFTDDSATGLANAIFKNINCGGYVGLPEDRRLAIAHQTRSFHMDNGLFTEEVDKQLLHLEQGAPIIRFAHQPNIFPYINITSQLIYLHHVAQELKKLGVKTVIYFFVVDYDKADDRRLNTAILPCPSCQTGQMSLTLGLKKQRKKLLINHLSSSEVNYQSWEQIWKNAFAELSHSLPRSPYKELLRNNVPPNISKDLAHRSLVLSDFLTAEIARFLILELNLPILFLPLSKCLTLFNEEAAQIIAPIIHKAKLGSLKDDHPTKLPLWYICKTCGDRVRVFANGKAVYASCRHCKIELEEPNKHALDAPLNLFGNRVVPDVTLDYCLDYTGYRIVGGSGYASGVNAAEYARNFCTSIGINLPPEVFWKLDILYPGPAEAAIYYRHKKLNSSFPDLSKGEKLALDLAKNGLISSQFFRGLPAFGHEFFEALSSALSTGSPTRQHIIQLPDKVIDVDLQTEIIEFLRRLKFK